jgi:hypothetical protein
VSIDCQVRVPLGGSRVRAMSETQVALRFPRAFPRLCAPLVGGMGLWCSELPTSTYVNRFLARWPSPGPVGSPPRGVHRGSCRLACCRAFVTRLPGATTARPLRRVARLKTHLAPARFGTTERLLQGFPKSRPSIDITAGVHSRVRSGCPARPLRPVAASDRLVPPSWSRTTSTVSSTGGSWACCIPLPILGFIGFRPCVVTALGAFSPESPPTPYPPELSPPAQPHRHSCRPLPSCRFGLRSWCYQGPPTSRPCSARASVVVNLRCRSSTPVALLGFPVSEAPRPSSLLTYADRSRRPLGPRSPLGRRRQVRA